jgi:DNA-binding LacI/PurR family transcriptional regulator
VGTDRVTLRVLAEDLGVSRATVSNAYNRPDQLSEALRARILARAGELGFAGPDPVARGLRRGRVGAVGVLVDHSISYAFSDPVAVLVLDGLAEELQADGFGLLLHAASERAGGEHLVQAAAVDGWVLMTVPARHPTVAAAAGAGRPLVVLDEPALPGAPRVTIDDVGGARAAAEHLLGLGHRRIGVLTAPLHGDGRPGLLDPGARFDVGDTVMATRLATVTATLEAAGVQEGAMPVVECSANAPEAGREGTALLLEGPVRPTAVLALSDQLALGALGHAREHRLRVPGALSVIGFDDAPPGRTSHPALTTVAQPIRERGTAAGRLMRGLLRGEPITPPPPFPTRLVVRGSTAPPQDR